MVIRALLIDDEPPARTALQNLLALCCPQVSVIGQTGDPVEGIALVRELQPDLLFLDVEMPRLSGFDVLRALGTDIGRLCVIFVTAYDQYAIRAFRFAALDYLLKPVDPDQLIAAVERVKRPESNTPALPAPAPDPRFSELFQALGATRTQPLTRLTVPTTDGLLVVPIVDILCFEAAASYSMVYLRGHRQPLVVSRPLKEYDDLLSEHGFFRVHHSWLINLAEVRRYVRGEGGLVELSDGRQVDVAKRRKEEFLTALAQR